MKRKCPKCGKVKDESEFPASGKKRRHHECKRCVANQVNKWVSENREKWNARARVLQAGYRAKKRANKRIKSDASPVGSTEK